MVDGLWTLSRAGCEISRQPVAPAIALRVRNADEDSLTRAAELLGAALPPGPGVARADNGGRLCWLAPGEWLLLDLELTPKSLVAAIAPATCHVADVGEAYARFRITGEQALAVLAKGTSLDLTSLIAGGGCARTRFAQIHALFAVAVAGEPALDLLADITCGEHLEHWFKVATLDLTAEGNLRDGS